MKLEWYEKEGAVIIFPENDEDRKWFDQFPEGYTAVPVQVDAYIETEPSDQSRYITITIRP